MCTPQSLSQSPFDMVAITIKTHYGRTFIKINCIARTRYLNEARESNLSTIWKTVEEVTLQHDAEARKIRFNVDYN